MRAVRKIHFCAGHRILGHESKCANAHGHNYTAWFYAEAQEQDQLGRVVDFSILKEKIGVWIDENLDHTFIIFKDDHELLSIKDKLTVNKEVYILDRNPTAENLALHLLNDICPKILQGSNVVITKIKLFETENCFVEVENK